MFTKLTDFAYKRTPLQAVGFYFSFLFIIVLLSLVASGVIGSSVQLTADGNYLIGVSVAFIIILLLSSVIAKDKNIYKDFKVVALIAVSLGVTVYLGAIIGLLPVAYLTTLNDNA